MMHLDVARYFRWERQLCHSHDGAPNPTYALQETIDPHRSISYWPQHPGAMAAPPSPSRPFACSRERAVDYENSCSPSVYTYRLFHFLLELSHSGGCGYAHRPSYSPCTC